MEKVPSKQKKMINWFNKHFDMGQIFAEFAKTKSHCNPNQSIDDKIRSESPELQ